MRQSELYRNSWEAAPIKNAFDILKCGSHSGLEMFKEELAKDASIDLNEKVWEYSIRYWKSHGEQPYKLRSALVGAFSWFLDAYTVHRILLLQNDPLYSSIIVCTGSTHSHSIYDALKRIGYRDICDPIIDKCEFPTTSPSI